MYDAFQLSEFVRYSHKEKEWTSTYQNKTSLNIKTLFINNNTKLVLFKT